MADIGDGYGATTTDAPADVPSSMHNAFSEERRAKILEVVSVARPDPYL